MKRNESGIYSLTYFYLTTDTMYAADTLLTPFPTLRSGGNLSTRYLFHDPEGSPRDGVDGRPLPRFLTPREVIDSTFQ